MGFCCALFCFHGISLMPPPTNQHFFWGHHLIFFSGEHPSPTLDPWGIFPPLFPSTDVIYARPVSLNYETVVETKGKMWVRGRQSMATLSHGENPPAQQRCHRAEHPFSTDGKMPSPDDMIWIPGSSPTWNQLCLEFSVLWTKESFVFSTCIVHIQWPLTPCDFLNLN